MSWIDRINRKVAAHIHRDAPKIVVEDASLKVTMPDGETRVLPLASLTRATLLHRDVFSHDAILIALAFADGANIELFMDDPQWAPLADALDRDGRIATPSATWQIEAIADGPGAPPRELLAENQGS